MAAKNKFQNVEKNLEKIKISVITQWTGEYIGYVQKYEYEKEASYEGRTFIYGG